MIEIVPRVNPWIPQGRCVVVRESEARYTVASDRHLSREEILTALSAYFGKKQDAAELNMLREDCEAGMNLDNAREALKEMDEISRWEKVSNMIEKDTRWTQSDDGAGAGQE